MATKVHDQDDDEFAEIDIILAQAKRDRKQLRRNMNLSDIPENFAHVPPYEPQCTAVRPVSLDTSQPDLASRDCRSRARAGANPKLHILGMMAPMKWLRGYMGCLMAVQDSVASPDGYATRPASRRGRHGL